MVINHPEHHFIFCFDRSFSDRFLFGPNITPLIIRPAARHALIFLWWYQVALPYVYRRHRADIYYAPDGFLPLSPLVKNTVATIHDLAYLHYPDQISRSNLWYYRKFVPRHLKKADKIIAVSEATRNDIQRHFPWSAHKITTVHNAARAIFLPLTQC